jgi:hypothetical protein
MIIECPHCHTRILPRKDNTCPACRKDLADVGDVDPNMVSLIIHESQELPPFCYSCNLYTERFVRLTSEDDAGVAEAILSLAELLLLRPKWSRHNNEVGTSNVYIYLPQCEQCAEEFGRPEPITVDFEHQTMKFLVHRGFRDRVHPPQPEADANEQDDQSASEQSG